MVRHGVIDKATALHAGAGRSPPRCSRGSGPGTGTRIDVSMLDVALAFLWPDGMMNHTCLEPSEVLPPVSRSFRVTPTADGLVLVTLTAEQWDGLVDALADGEGDGQRRPERHRRPHGRWGGDHARGPQATRELPTDEVVAGWRRRTCPCAPVRALDELHLDQQIEASGRSSRRSITR